MGDSSTTTTDLDQADEEILTYTVSDEALEAAAGTGGAPYPTFDHFTVCVKFYC